MVQCLTIRRVAFAAWEVMMARLLSNVVLVFLVLYILKSNSCS